MTGSELNHAPSHLREQFQEWLDSHEPDRLPEMDIRPVAPLLDALADCTDVLPADYCDQLEIGKGSTYARAVQEVREFHAQQHGDDIAAFTSLRVEDFTFEQRPSSDLPENDVTEWLEDFGGDDYGYSESDCGDDEAHVVWGDHIILWQDRPITDLDKKSVLYLYEGTVERRRVTKEAISFLETHGLSIRRGWYLNGDPPSDVREYLEGLIERCFPTDEAKLTEEIIKMIGCNPPCY